MKEIRYYEAFDGKQFDDENDCLEYETQSKFLSTNSLILKSFEGTKIETINENTLDSVEIIVIKNEEACSMTSAFNTYYDYDFPTEIGAYWWYDVEQRWLNYTEVENLYNNYGMIKNELEQYFIKEGE